MAARGITYDDILRDLKAQKIAPVYYLMGDEDYYIDKLSDAVVDAVLSKDERDFNLDIVYGAETDINKVIDTNYIYIHVNYNPRKSEGAEKNQQAKAMLARLNNPARFGFPVFVVLDADGKVLHTQDSSFLEEGKGYNKEKVLRFLNNWTRASVNACLINN